MRVIDIVPGTTVDGPGLRTAIYFAGCRHRCPGCHNPQSWSEEAGREMEIDDILAVVDENGFDVTFSGGDPMSQAEELYKLARRIKESGRNIWCYTGYLYEDVMAHEFMRRVLDYVDVLVDGPFVEARKDRSVLFRGSSNQRLIDVARSTSAVAPVLWDGESFTAVF